VKLPVALQPWSAELALLPIELALAIGPWLQHLAAGIDSGIDPRKDPVGFRNAGERGMRPVRLTPARSQK